MRFTFTSKRGICWTVECWQSGDENSFTGYMWHRKEPERITGGWREARKDAMSDITQEAIAVAKDRFGINLSKY